MLVWCISLDQEDFIKLENEEWTLYSCITFRLLFSNRMLYMGCSSADGFNLFHFTMQLLCRQENVFVIVTSAL